MTTPSTSRSASNKIKTSLTLKEKYEIILLHENENISANELRARKSCGKTQIYDILRKREEIKRELLEYGANPHSKRKLKSTKNLVLNEDIWSWYRGEKENGNIVTGIMVKNRAKEMAKKLGILDFKGSNGWLQSFQNRHNISFSQDNTQHSKMNNSNIPIKRRINSIKSEQQTVNSIKYMEPEEIINEDSRESLNALVTSYEKKKIGAIIETGFYYKSLPDDEINNSTNKINMVICFYADGHFEKPLLIGKTNDVLKTNQDINDNIIWKTNENGILTVLIIKEYLINLNKRLKSEYKKIVLILNKSKYHPQLELSNIKLVFLKDNQEHPLNNVLNLFKIHYRYSLLKTNLPLLGFNGDHRAFEKYFVLNDAIQLLRKSITEIPSQFVETAFKEFGLVFLKYEDEMDEDEENQDYEDPLSKTIDTIDQKLNLLEEIMKIGKFINCTASGYLNIDKNLLFGNMNEGDDSIDEFGDERENDDGIMSLAKATIYLIQIKNMLYERGADSLIGKLEEIQNDISELCLEEKKRKLT